MWIRCTSEAETMVSLKLNSTQCVHILFIGGLKKYVYIISGVTFSFERMWSPKIINSRRLRRVFSCGHNWDKTYASVK